MRKYRRLCRAALIALAGAGALSGCYYDPYTGLWYAYPPYYPYPMAYPYGPADPISGARVRAVNNSTRQCADPAGTTAAANPIVGQIHPESRAASERNAAMILSASPRAPGSWVRM